jgi:hypothetical protein
MAQTEDPGAGFAQTTIAQMGYFFRAQDAACH